MKLLTKKMKLNNWLFSLSYLNSNFTSCVILCYLTNLPQDDNKYFGTSLTLQEGKKVDGNFLKGREGAGI